MKTIGAKVEDFVYERVNRLGSISDVVRSAVFEFLEKHEDSPDSLVNHGFNHKSNASGNDDIEL